MERAKRQTGVRLWASHIDAPGPLSFMSKSRIAGDAYWAIPPRTPLFFTRRSLPSICSHFYDTTYWK